MQSIRYVGSLGALMCLFVGAAFAQDAAGTAGATQTVNFPEGWSLGRLFSWEDEGGDREELGDARGAVELPTDKHLGVRVYRGMRPEMSVFALFEPFDLQSLELRQVNVDDESLAAIAPLHSLRTLWLDNNPITDAGMAHLAGLKKLRVLGLARTRIGSPGLAQLAGLTHLTELDLTGTDVDDAGVALLKPLAALRKLDLTDTQVTSQGHTQLVAARPECRVTWTAPKVVVATVTPPSSNKALKFALLDCYGREVHEADYLGMPVFIISGACW